MDRGAFLHGMTRCRALRPGLGVASPSTMLVLASDAIAVAGITAGGTLIAGGGLAFVTLRVARLRLKHDRELADLSDLRALLDETAIALDRAVPVELVSPRLTGHDRQLEAKQRMDEDALALDALHTRLSVRLSPRHEITLALGEAIQSLRGIADQIPRGQGALSNEALDARAQVMDRSWDGLKSWSAEFIEAAVRRAGTASTRGEADDESAG